MKNRRRSGSLTVAIGIDIEKPFEAISLEPEKDYLDYIAVLYIAIGTKEGFSGGLIDNVKVETEESHPTTEVAEEHFVISVYPIRLPYEK